MPKFNRAGNSNQLLTESFFNNFFKKHLSLGFLILDNAEMAPRRQKFRASVYLITKPIFNILIQYAGICLKFQWIFYFMYLKDPNCWIWYLFLPISLRLFIEILSKNYTYYLAKFSKFTIPILMNSV